jgi:hypothetical protein
MKQYVASVRSVIARSSVALACLLGVGVIPAQATAGQTTEDDINRARRLFQRAVEYEQAKQWGKALELFREVGAVKLTPQVRFHIAWCEENLGKLVAALGGYELALAQADQVGQAFIEEVQEKVDRLKGVIPKLVVKRGKGGEAATISLDGVELGANSIGVEMPVDPGPHTVTAEAPGREDFMGTVSVGEEEVKTLVVKMKKSEKPTTGGGGGGGGGGDKQPWTPPDRTVPYIIGGAGGVFLIGAGVLFYLRESSLSKLEDLCGDGGFSSCAVAEEDQGTAQGYRDDAQLYTTLSGISAGVGVVAVGVAATMIFTEPSPPPETGSIRLAPAAPGADAGISVFGWF